MKCSFGISDFLEVISSLSHSVVFLYFFALITEEGFLISSCYSLELKWVYLSFSPLLLTSLLFTAICKASPESDRRAKAQAAVTGVLSAVERSYPTSEARGGGREDQPHALAARAQEGLEELSHVEGQDGLR